MHFVASTVAAVLGMAASAQAHMAMSNPAPLGSPANKLTKNPDYDMTTPLSHSQNPDTLGAFPCRGHLSLASGEQGASVAQWPAGSKQSLSINGGAWHSGGSCQASLSYDQGKTWTVIHSWLGSCPTGPGPSTYDFTVPADAAAGKAIFGWSWFNKVGNREMYMNCAVVTIGGGGSASARRDVSTPFSSRPEMFVANVGKGCGTTEGTDLQFPNPGPDVTVKAGNFAPPTGSCPGSTPDGSQKPPAANPPASSAAAVPPPASSSSSSAAAVVPPPVSSGSPVPVPSATQSVPGGVFIPTSSATGPGAVPTTIQTSVRPSQSAPPAGPPPAVTSSAAPAGPPPPPPAATPGAPPAGGAAGFPAWSKCPELGAWNCIGGNMFQRCGAGNMWSPAQSLAAGTSCKVGVNQNIIFV